MDQFALYVGQHPMHGDHQSSGATASEASEWSDSATIGLTRTSISLALELSCFANVPMTATTY
jgi:hypothetical protein